MESEWTAADQQRADTFERQITEVARQLRDGHPDAIVVAFVQTLGSLMVDRLAVAPSSGAFYLRMIHRLAMHVADAMPRSGDAPTTTH